MAIHTNLAYATLSAGITSTATSLTVKTGQGARFGSGQWYGVIWDKYYDSAAKAMREPTTSCAEIVLATSNGTDTITLTRAQESTTARAFNRAGRTYEIALVTVGADLSASSAHVENKYGNGIEGSNSVTWDTAFDNVNYPCVITIQTADGDWTPAREIVQTVDGVTWTQDTAGAYKILAVAK